MPNRLIILFLGFILISLFRVFSGLNLTGPCIMKASDWNSCLNPIDTCILKATDWKTNPKTLADCAVGFGKNAMGGRYGMVYKVTDDSDSAVNPKKGTLRYAVTRSEPLWIIFDKDMLITLENELLINSYKTIDGRGMNVEIGRGPCVTIQNAKHVIVHGISIHRCTCVKPGLVQNSPSNQTKIMQGANCDGDAIRIANSSHVWVDHCQLANATDGLIDVTLGSTDITISNSQFTKHDKVMLLGHGEGHLADKFMRVTVAFNHFGPGLGQRMPRVRYGYAHVANNYYEPWDSYAIGGSSHPTILSEGNYFYASNNPNTKEVTSRAGGAKEKDWRNWNWTTRNDVFKNGAVFVSSGKPIEGDPPYSKAQKFQVAPGSTVPNITSNAGPLTILHDGL